MTPESALSKAIRLEASQRGHRLFRNNVGMFTDRKGYVVRFGLAVGSADLIGWTRTGKFASIEVKVGRGRPTEYQRKWCAAAREAGCAAGIVWSVEEAMTILDGQP